MLCVPKDFGTPLVDKMKKQVNGEVWLFYDKKSLKGAAKKKGGRRSWRSPTEHFGQMSSTDIERYNREIVAKSKTEIFEKKSAELFDLHRNKKGFHAKLHHIATGKHDMFFSEPKKLRAKPVMIPSMVKIPALEAAEAAAKREESGGAKSGQELKSADESAEQAARADAEMRSGDGSGVLKARS